VFEMLREYMCIKHVYRVKKSRVCVIVIERLSGSGKLDWNKDAYGGKEKKQRKDREKWCSDGRL